MSTQNTAAILPALQRAASMDLASNKPAPAKLIRIGNFGSYGIKCEELMVFRSLYLQGYRVKEMLISAWRVAK